MNFDILLPLLATTIIAILGWLVGYNLNAKRDRLNKLRELRLQFLIDAYRKLANFAGKELYPESRAAIDQEEAIADIQLFGNQEQIEKLLSEMRPGGDINPVLNLLRDELRKELDLPPVKKNVEWVRY